MEVIFESNGFPMNFMNVHSDYDIKIQLVYLIFKISLWRKPQNGA